MKFMGLCYCTIITSDVMVKIKPKEASDHLFLIILLL